MAKTNADIEHWDVESEEFWEREGKKVASRQPVDFHPQPADGIRHLADVGNDHHPDEKPGVFFHR